MLHSSSLGGFSSAVPMIVTDRPTIPAVFQNINNELATETEREESYTFFLSRGDGEIIFNVTGRRGSLSATL